MIPNEAYAFLVILVGLPLGLFMDRLAALRRPGSERGDYWTRAVAWLSVLGLLGLFSGWLPSLSEPLWERGLHLQLDRVLGSGLPARAAYLAALAIPLALWALLLFAGLVLRPRSREAARWLAGRSGERPRSWVLAGALPLLAALVWGYSGLGAGPAGYPAATWSTQALLVVSLLFLARSAGTAPAEPERSAPAPQVAPARELRPWPLALASRGITLRRLTGWPADAPARRVEGAAAELADRLHALGARGVAPEMVEAAARLLEPPGRRAPACLVLAPDACGQVEVLGLVAGDVAQRFNEVTLVITPATPAGLAASLAPWLPPEYRAEAVGPDGKPAERSTVWVVDAETLSERFLRRLANDRLAHRIGLVVWWDVHHYTGVLAANVWAISRRLDRLLRAQGRSEVRLLVLVRHADHGDAQLPGFIRELLPYDLPGEQEVHVERRTPRPIEVHVLTGQRAFFDGAGAARIPSVGRHPLLVAALVSTEEGWPTCLERPREGSDFEVNPVLQLPVEERLLRDHLLPGIPEAGARLSALEPGDVLSLVAMASQGGRAAAGGLPHHWGLLLPPNPYVPHLLTRWAETHGGRREMPASRRLVPPRGSAHILRRHLLLALGEQKDTLEGLYRTFRWEEGLIHSTLAWIAGERRLDRGREVRFLTPEGRLQSDRLHESLLPAEEEVRPLDTVGTRLVEVRDPAGGVVCLRVDPERLTIQCYPGRVFLHAGRRYQVDVWESHQEVVAKGWVGCSVLANSVRTWRIRRPSVYLFRNPGPEVAIDPEGRLVRRLVVDLTYEEEVEGTLRLERELTSGADRPQVSELRRPVAAAFATRALVLRLPFAPPREALDALCLALRHVLPVHLGAEEDAIEVVALAGDPAHRLGNSQVWGLAIVDLYPGGIGLADALGEDNALPLLLLECTRDWLRQPGADVDLLASPLARATLGRERPDSAAAVALLERLAGPAAS